MRSTWPTILLIGLLAAQFGTQPVLVAQAASQPKPSQPNPSRPRPLRAPGAAVSINAPTNFILGDDVSFSVTFSNTGSSTGYGPFIDIVLDSTGADGNDGLYPPGPPAPTLTATYLGSPIPAGDLFILTFNGANQATHPLVRDTSGNFITINGATFGASPGDTLVVVRLPFGSFTPGQPPATVDLTVNSSNLADVGTPLDIHARGGFQFGATPLDDWCCDNPVSTISSPPAAATVTPILYTASKTYNGPEDETATGPNFPRSYTLTVDIATGQSMSNLVVTDVLPSNVQFISVTSSPGFNSSSLPSTSTPGGTLSLTYNSITGGSSASDITITVNFYIPRLDLLGGDVIPPITGDDRTSTNSVTAQGDWLPIDTRDWNPSPPPNTISVAGACGTPCTHTLTDKSIAIQKGAAVVGGGTLGPNKVLQYTLNFQVSDFFAFNDIFVTDTISDGQHVDPTFTPTLQIAGNTYSWPATAMLSTPLTDPVNWTYDIACNYSAAPGPECTTDNTATPNDGTTALTFQVSREIIQRLLDANGRMVGGCVDPVNGSASPTCSGPGSYNNGPTTGTIVFRTVVQDNYTDSYLPPAGSGDPSVDQGDRLDDSVTIDGAVLNTSDFSPTGNREDDTSAATLTVPTGSLSKEIYAVNGAAPGNPVTIKPGDAVTYRIRYTLPTGDEENLQFDDYLPLPIFDATEVTTFDATVSAASPPAGHAKFGPSDTFYNYTCLGTGTPAGCLAPTLTTNSGLNRLSFTYGDFNGPAPQAYQVDLLFTVTVSDQPFADRLYLTNEVRGSEGSTQNIPVGSNAIIQLILTEPVLVSTKTVFWAGDTSGNPHGTIGPAIGGAGVTILAPGSAPRWTGNINSTWLAAHPLDSNIIGVDAADIVTFAIVIQNNGTSLNGAFDITLKDDLPAQYQIPASGLDLQVYYGNGTGPISYTKPDDSPAVDTDLLGGGIKLVDPVGQGACQAHDPNLGNDIILVTFDLQLKDNVTPGTIINTESLLNYAGEEGGPNFLAQPQTDTASATVQTSMAKSLVSTEINNSVNSNTQVVIGELATYQIVVTVPEGVVPAAQIVDTLDNGLAFVQCLSVTPSSSDLTTSYGAGDFSDMCSPPTNPVITNTGHTATWTLGDITNANRNNAVTETLTIQYTVAALNIVGNQTGTALNNSARYSWTGGSMTRSAPNVTVIESNVNIAKAVNPPTGDAGDPITYTITLSGATTTDAFDVTLEDTIPALIDSPSLTNVSDTELVTPVTISNFDLTGSSLTTVTPFDMPVSATRQIVLTITGTISYSASPSQVITNTALTRWTSLNGDFTSSSRSAYNTSAVERTGAQGVGGALNDYAKSSAAAFTVNTGSTNKTLVTTSEAGTTGSDVAIGEIVRYRIPIVVPEGTSTNLEIRDLLPAGMMFLNDGTASVALVSSGSLGSCAGSQMTSNTLSGSGLWVCGDETTIAGIVPTFILPASAIVNGSNPGNPFANGDHPYFSLGTITNNDSDSNQEFVVVEYNALVMNVIGNQNGSTLDNQYQVWLNGSQLSTSNILSVNVVESNLTLNKTNDKIAVTVDAGDTVTYTVTVANNGNAPAYEARFLDSVPSPWLTLNLASINVTYSFLGGTSTDNSAGNNLDITIATIPAGESATITYQAAVDISVTPQQVINNLGNLTWTSLPGTGTSGNATGSTTPGASGASNGERNGTGGVNDYSATSGSTITISTPQIVKSIFATSESSTGNVGGTEQVTIGEQITYDILFTIPEGTTPSDQVVDNLPAGLQVVGTPTVITTAAASGGSLSTNFSGTIGTESITIGPGNDSVTFAFTNIVVPGDNNTNNNTLLLRFTAVVLNVAGNQNNGTLSNTASNQVGSNTPTNSNTVTVRIVEAVVQVAKSVDDPTPGSGQVLHFTLTFVHATSGPDISQSNAFDAVITDALPSGLSNPSNIVITDNYLGGCPASTNVQNTSSGSTVSATIGTFPLGACLRITFDATVLSSFNTSMTNTATVTWTSLPGADTNERTGAGGVNDYTASDTLNISVTRNLVKNLIATSAPSTGNVGGREFVTIGEILTYQVVLTIPAGTTDTAIVTDTLDSGLAFVDCAETAPAGPNNMHDIIIDSNQVTSTAFPSFALDTYGNLAANCNHGTNAGTNNPLISNSGGTIRFDLGNVTNSDTAPHTITLTYRVAVLDSTQNVRNVFLGNSVVWTWATGTLPRVLAPQVEIIEPGLGIDKSVDPTVAALGTTITYTIRVFHTPNSQTDAFDVTIFDVVPPAVTYVPNSLQWVPGSGPAPDILDDTGIDPVTGRVRLSAFWFSFPLGTPPSALTESLLQFQATVTDPPRSRRINNTADVVWSSLPGDVSAPQSVYQLLSTERRYQPGSQTDVYGASDSALVTLPRGLPGTGFAPYEVTLLPPQPEDRQYQNLGDLWLEVPRLGVQLPIVGVPATNDGDWDLTWLGDQAGYLDGTAYPTHAGNSVLTAHVYMPDGTPGPFVDLHTLKWGDQVIIHLGGQRYIYEVRQEKVVSPDNTSVFKHEDYPWVTLVTCKDYDAATNTYAHRVIVRAVLVKVEADPAASPPGNGR